MKGKRKMKKYISPLIAAVLAVQLMDPRPALASASDKMRPSGVLRLMAYNIHHGAGADGRLDLKRTAAAIRRDKPDFVALNEVDRCTRRVGGIDTCKVLGELVGLYATFGKAIDYGGGGYGNAVLSREKPRDVLRVPLPGREPRLLLLCEFADFWFGTMHLDFGAYQPVSVEIVRKIVEEKAKTKPVFLTGDWNNTPQSATLDMVRRFATVLSGERCRTFHGFSSEKIDKKYCIDYIAVDSAHADDFAVLDAHVTPDEMTSDHNPITVVLEPAVTK
jgi:endonuclease/exonuclease/phosphatase family metal-dependent hydrolase